MTKKQTAVDWLAKELESYGDPQFCEIEWEQLDSLIQQAKEMEKEQIVNAVDGFPLENRHLEGEQYYNKTFEA